MLVEYYTAQNKFLDRERSMSRRTRHLGQLKQCLCRAVLNLLLVNISSALVWLLTSRASLATALYVVQLKLKTGTAASFDIQPPRLFDKDHASFLKLPLKLPRHQMSRPHATQKKTRKTILEVLNN